LGKGVVPQVGHLGQDVVKARELNPERTEPIAVGEEHRGNPQSNTAEGDAETTGEG
jgi:hypothetical protein